MVNNHEKKHHLGEYCFGTFSKHRTCKSKLTMFLLRIGLGGQGGYRYVEIQSEKNTKLEERSG